MTPPDPGDVRIRNQRYRPWVEMLLFILTASATLGTFGLAAGLWPAGLDRIGAGIILGFCAGLGVLWGCIWLRLWDLRRPPKPGRDSTTRNVFQWLVLGIRRKELGPADGWTALTAFRGLLPSRISVPDLKLGEGVEIGALVDVRFPAGAVERVRFTPDPQEDYGGSESPLRFCEAAVEMDSGKVFHLILDEADARRLRKWAVAKGIAVYDSDGYEPPPAESLATADEPNRHSPRGTRA